LNYYSAILAFLLVLAAAGNTFARVVELPLEPIKSQFHEPHEVVEIYLQAVGRGELVVFDRKLDRSMLTPVRVIYVYDLDSAIPRIKVYSKLKESMPVPGQKNIKFRGVSVILDADGRIIETEAHIWPE
jgi:hypothetical protein